MKVIETLESKVKNLAKGLEGYVVNMNNDFDVLKENVDDMPNTVVIKSDHKGKASAIAISCNTSIWRKSNENNEELN